MQTLVFLVHDAIQATRRERLLKFIDKFYPNSEQWSLAFRCYGHAGIIIIPNDLTDTALERFAARLRSEFWFSKKLRRQNRAAALARQAQEAT